jgi:hypothetical protein
MKSSLDVKFLMADFRLTTLNRCSRAKTGYPVWIMIMGLAMRLIFNLPHSTFNRFKEKRPGNSGRWFHARVWRYAATNGLLPCTNAQQGYE